MIRWFLFPLVIVLAGCAQAPIIKTVQVKVPVPVPCDVQPIHAPDWALDHVTAADSDYVWARAALVEIGQHYAYETRLTAAIDACR